MFYTFIQFILIYTISNGYKQAFPHYPFSFEVGTKKNKKLQRNQKMQRPQSLLHVGKLADCNKALTMETPFIQ